MKIVRTHDLEINTDHNGVLLKIDTSGIVVSDEVAEELHIKFGHTLDISDVIEETPVTEEEIAPVVEDTNPEIVDTEEIV